MEYMLLLVIFIQINFSFKMDSLDILKKLFLVFYVKLTASIELISF